MTLSVPTKTLQVAKNSKTFASDLRGNCSIFFALMPGLSWTCQAMPGVYIRSDLFGVATFGTVNDLVVIFFQG